MSAARQTIHQQVRRLYSVPDRQVPRASFVPAGRTLHLVDVENLMGGPTIGQKGLESAVNAYRDIAPVCDGDHVVVGSNPSLGVAIKTLWPGARVLVRRGPDGADKALLESVIDVQFVAQRYDSIVVGSGDGVFEAVVDVYKPCGLAVGVVSRRSSLSYSLGAAASFVRLLPEVNQEGVAV